ncbi:gliding motility protein GldM [Limibacter armeniacum]|uniref:type IX secretion system motor protein PorM/GldM n=1 Tax=Limibacter armeniacum TaxID=466084 RepID=UPI002FE58C43
MANRKETPRQKMINLMYLVLLALLALQVSNTVLDKFIFIEKSLQFSNNITEKENDKMMDAISKVATAKKQQNPIQEAFDDAQAIKTRTNEVTGLIKGMKDKIRELAGEDPETGELTDKANYDGQMNFTIGPEGKKNGKAYELKAKLDEYVNFLNKIGKEHEDSSKVFTPIEKIAKDGKEIPEYANSKDPMMKENRKKDFAYLQFDHTPNVAALAVLSQLESDVLQAEASVLNILAKKVDAKVDFDKVIPVVKPESKYVAAGTKYVADMFIAASSSAARPKMMYNGETVSVNDGVGKIEFVATPGQYDKDGRVKKIWEGSITYRTPFGDTTLMIEEEYYVVKPTIEINSATVNALYRNCANELIVDVPALGQSYNPTFTASNAKLENKGKAVTIYPDVRAREVALTVKSDGNMIGTKKFQTRGIPKPDIVVLADGKEVDLKRGIPENTRQISVRVKPNEEFAAALPKEASYRAMEWEIIGARGTRPVGSPIKLSGGRQDASLDRLARESGRLVIDIKTVLRKNSKGQTEEVRGVSQVVNVPVQH